jgi:CHAD domain-containing protein
VAAPRTTLERELKLSIPDGFVLPTLPGQVVSSRSFTSTYYDTADLQLTRSGVTLRRRVESGKGRWQLKLPYEAARLELQLPGGPAGPPAPLREILAGVLHRGELTQIARLRTRRESMVVAGFPEPLAEIALDEVTVLDGRRVTARFTELEVELLGGGENDLKRLERQLRDAGALDGDGRPKILRALDFNRDAGAPSDSASAAEHVQAMLAAQYWKLLGHDPGLRVADEPEDVHQVRVAARRLRAVLRAARPLLVEEWAETLRDELRWLGQLLSPVRDLDVLLAYLRGEAASLQPDDAKAFRRALGVLERERAAARAAMLEGIRSERYLALLDTLAQGLESLPTTGEDLSLTDVAAAEFAKLRKAVKALPSDPTDADLHAVRIRGKRARYAAELAVPVGGRSAVRFVDRAKAFQDLVGEHQDAVVAEERLHALAGKVGARGAFAAGRIAERQGERRRRVRAGFRKEWSRLESAGKKAWS